VATSRWALGIGMAVLILMSAGCNSGSTANVQNPPPPPQQGVSVAFQSTPPGSVLVGSTAQLTATVTNDSSNAGVDWNVVCNASDCGTFGNGQTVAHTNSGQPVTYTPPATLPGNSQIVNIEGFATADHNKNVLASVTVTAFGNNISGTYVLQVQGLENSAPFQMVGAIALDGNGNVTTGQGTINFNNASSVISESVSISGGSYFLGSDGRGTLTINTSDTTSIGSLTLNLAYLSNAHLLVSVQANNVGGNLSTAISASGTMDLQTTSTLSALSGGYAFVMSGTDCSTGGPVGLGGVFNVDSPNNISGAGSIADEYNNTGASSSPLYPQIPISPSTVTSPTSPGTFNLVLNLNNSTNQLTTATTLNIQGYMVDATHIKLIEDESQQGSSCASGSLAGLAIAQTPPSGGFAPSSFSGTYVFGLLGTDLDPAATTLLPDTFTAAGLVVSDGAGDLINGYVDSAFQAASAEISGTFAATIYDSESTGRFDSRPLHFPTDQCSSTSSASYLPKLIFYLTGPPPQPGSSAVPIPVLAGGIPCAINSPPTNLLPFFATGLAYPQTTGSLTFSGNYGLYYSQQNGTEFDGSGEIMNVTPPSFSGVADLAGASDAPFSGTASSQSCSSSVNGCFAGSFSNNSSSAFQGNSGNNPTFNADFYMIDSTQGFFVENDLPQQSTPLVTLGYFAASTAPQPPASAKAMKRRHK